MKKETEKIDAGAKYCITRENAAFHELIGLDVKVAGGNCQERNQLKGRIMDETKNTFVIETEKGEKVVPKCECIFEFGLGKNGSVVIEGKKILKKPEDRVKEWRN
jgi:ribonuclease P protein subunit POP4